jgi:hypothetical protein
MMDQLVKVDLKPGDMIKSLVDKFFKSDLAEQIGEFIGSLIGTVIAQVASVTGFLADKVGGNKLTAGFKKGFEAAGGPAALGAIFKDVFKLMFEGLKFVMGVLPWQAYALLAAAVVIPPAIAGITMFAAQGIANALMSGFARGLGHNNLEDMVAKVFQTIFANKKAKAAAAAADDVIIPVDVTDITNKPKALPPGKPSAGALPSSALGPKAAQAPGLFAKIGTALKNFWRMLTAPIAAFGKLNVATAALTGVIEFVTAIFTGKDLAEALGKTAGPVIGSLIGGALLGPLGAAIGGWIGGMKPVVDTFTGIFKGIGWALQNAWAAIGPSLEALGGIVKVVWDGFIGLIPGLDNASGGLDLLNLAFIAVKVALSPFITILNGVAFALQALRLGLLKFDLWVNKTFQWSDREGRIQVEIDKAQKAMEETALRQKRLNDDLLKPLEQKVKGKQPGTQAKKKELAKPVTVEAPKIKIEPYDFGKSVGAFVKSILDIPHKIEQAFLEARTNLNRKWVVFKSWWTSLPNKFDQALKETQTDLHRKWVVFTSWWESLFSKSEKPKDKANTGFSKAIDDFVKGFEEGSGIKLDFSGIIRQWDRFIAWVSSLSSKTQSAITRAVSGLQAAWSRFTSWFTGLGSKFPSQVSSVVSSLSQGTSQIVNAIVNWAKNLPGQIASRFMGGQSARTPVGTQWDPKLKKTVIVYSDGSTSAAAQAFGSANSYSGSLGQAISFEQKNKPPGSDLVIANTSETVIPAAGGYGMLDFVETLRSGFNRMATVFQTAQQTQSGLLRQLNNTLVSNQQQTNARLATLETKFTSPTMPGGLGGASAGGVDAFTSVAQGFGLQMTSGYRPGDPGWHGANRARDFSNGTGPTPQMMQFAQYLASTYGSSLKELIYTPLGYSVKDGQIVPPYAQNSHYNHVHVAYALGPNNGKMFTNLSAARSWEESMVPGSVKVASITGNSGEGFGGETSVVNNFTITQQPGEDGEALANRVATLFYDAMNNAQSASIFG